MRRAHSFKSAQPFWDYASVWIVVLQSNTKAIGLRFLRAAINLKILIGNIVVDQEIVGQEIVGQMIDGKEIDGEEVGEGDSGEGKSGQENANVVTAGITGGWLRSRLQSLGLAAIFGLFDSRSYRSMPTSSRVKPRSSQPLDLSRNRQT